MDKLSASIARGDVNEVKRILNENIDLNSQDRDGRTALMHAVIDGKFELVELLVKYGADVQVQDSSGYSALHFAAQNFRCAEARLLLDAGAFVDPTDKYGNTPLWRAVFASQGRGDMIKVLLDYGADRLLKNKSGKSSVELANTIGNYDVKQFFQEQLE